MKKILLTMIATVAVCTFASAQNMEGFSWGTKLGFNISNLSNTIGNAKLGFTGGVFGEYQFPSRFSVTGDLLYSREGSRIRNNSDNKRISKLHYLNIPILANYYVIDGLAVKAGLQPGILLGSRIKIKENGVVRNGSSNYKTMDISMPIGISYEPSFTYNFILDVRYNIGLAKVVNGSTSIRNNFFSLTVGSRF